MNQKAINLSITRGELLSEESCLFIHCVTRAVIHILLACCMSAKIYGGGVSLAVVRWFGASDAELGGVLSGSFGVIALYK